MFFFFFQAEDGIRDRNVTGVQTCALPISLRPNLEWVSIADVISDVLDRMEPLLPDHAIAVELAEPVPPTPLDFVQISQVRSEERRVGKECRSRWSTYD